MSCCMWSNLDCIQNISVCFLFCVKKNVTMYVNNMTVFCLFGHVYLIPWYTDTMTAFNSTTHANQNLSIFASSCTLCIYEHRLQGRRLLSQTHCHSCTQIAMVLEDWAKNLRLFLPSRLKIDIKKIKSSSEI